MNPRHTLTLTVLLSLVLLTAATPAQASCGATAVCIDCASSLMGGVIWDDVVLSWSTDDENSSVASYKLHRYNCGDPSTCSTLVTTISAAQLCGAPQNYAYTDTPSAPVSQWRYVLEVWKADGTRACATDVDPQ